MVPPLRPPRSGCDRRARPLFTMDCLDYIFVGTLSFLLVAALAPTKRQGVIGMQLRRTRRFDRQP